MEKLSLTDIKNSSPEQEFDFDKVYKECFVDVTKELKEPPIAMGIGYNSYKDKNYLNATFTYGELSAIIAPQKSKKSFFKRALAASYIGGQASNYFPSIVTCRNTDKFVLDFDTEQDEYYSLRAFKGVIEMVGNHYKNYLPFGIKKLSDKEMVLFIDGVVKKHGKNIGIMFIDGIADLCFNPNDIVQSNLVINKLKEWTSLGIHICCVIHKTFEKDKAFGHLGTYVQKKCETSIFLDVTDHKIKNSPVKVTQKDSRGAPFDDFYFDLDLNNLIPKECEQLIW